MKAQNVVSLVVTNNLPRLVVLGCATAYLALAGCSTNEAGTPKAAVNYRELSEARTENHLRSLEQVIKHSFVS